MASLREEMEEPVLNFGILNVFFLEDTNHSLSSHNLDRK